jgi:hypothetical protein
MFIYLFIVGSFDSLVWLMLGEGVIVVGFETPRCEVLCCW